MKTIKKAIAVMLCIAILCGTALIYDYNFVGSLKLIASATGDNYYMINGKTINCNSVEDTGDGNNESYISALYKYVWGISYTDDFSSSDNIIKNIKYTERTLTAENLEKFVKRTEPGTVIKVETISENEISSENGFSVFIVSYDNNGFTVYERTNERKETYYTWDSFCMIYQFSTIRFLKWPNSFFVSSVSKNETDYKKPERALYYDSVEMLNGDDVKWIQRKLADAGYKVSVDGYFSKSTEMAVKLFQKDFSLTVTGIVDSLTADMLEKPIKKPAQINLSVDKASNTSDLSIGDILTVSWGKIDYAEGYHIFIYNSRGKLVDELDNVTSNKASFVMSSSGTYTVKGCAQNEVFVGEISTMPEKVKVHNTYTVKFVDYDGTLLNKQTVPYGQDATVPSSPKRTGYSFKGWDTDFNNVTSSLTVTAQYIQKSFKVEFKDANGNRVGSSQNVLYGDAAVEPDTSSIKGFVGWNKDFSSVMQSMTVSAITVKDSSYLPFRISTARAKREADSGGYTVNFSVRNESGVKRIARAVVALKTTAGKFLTLTESSAFTVGSGANKDLKVVVPYEKAATLVEIYIVENYNELVPLSNVYSIADIQTEDNYTDWIPASQAPAVYFGTKDDRTEYRYRTRTTTSERYNSKTGWILYNTTVDDMIPSGWSGYSRNYASERNEILLDGQSHRTLQVESQWQTYTSGYNLEYWMTHAYTPKWVRRYWNYPHAEEIKGNGVHYNYKWVSADYFNSMGHVDVGGKTSGQMEGYNMAGVQGRTEWDGIVWYNTSATTDGYWVYRTQSFYPVYRYHFYKDSAWSEWSPNYISKGAKIDNNTSVLDVETRQTRRYLVNDPTVTNVGKTRTITGITDSSLAGKQATLFIYKIGEASDYTNEFIGQTTIAADGSYKFSFKLREEPTVETGDFTVTLGIEGTSGVTYLDSIKAPAAKYTVNIKDYDGSIIDTQSVNKGESAVLPKTNPERPGYTFAGWNYSNASIYEDTDIQALYVQNEYTVVFIDWVNEKFIMQTSYHYGDILETPDFNYRVEVDKLDADGNPVLDEDGNVVKEFISTANEAYVTTGWKNVTEEMTVTQNMVITAEYSEKTFEVNFYDYDKNIIDTQIVRYGDSAEAPKLESDNEHIFIAWDSCSFDCVTTSIDVNPIFSYTETVSAPTCNLKNGVYTQEQTMVLSCETPNSDIYYKVNNSNEKKYTEPVRISSTSKVSYYAVAENLNPSMIIESYFAINTADNTASWKYPVTIYNDGCICDVIFVSKGSTLNDGDYYEEEFISSYTYHNFYYHRTDAQGTMFGSDSSAPNWSRHEVDVPYQLPYYYHSSMLNTYMCRGYVCPICGDSENWIFERSYAEPNYSTRLVYQKYNYKGEKAYLSEGQKFAGYYTDSNFENMWDVGFPVTSALNLYIKSVPMEYSVNFCKEDGTVISSQNVKYLDKASAPQNVSVEAGKVFVGWDTDDYLCVTKDLTVKAIIKDESEIAKISLDKTKLETITGMNYQLEAIVTPDEYQKNAIVWSSSNNKIVSVDTNGLIKAVAPGKATVTAMLTGDYIRTATCEITVKPNISENITTLSDSCLRVVDGKLIGVSPSHNTVSDVFAEIDSGSLEAYSSEGKRQNDSDLLETGATINLIDKNGKILDSVTVIVMGDVNGDGLANVKDATMISRMQVGKVNLIGDARLAADVDGDGEVLQSDASRILEFIEGKRKL